MTTILALAHVMTATTHGHRDCYGEQDFNDYGDSYHHYCKFRYNDDYR